MSCSDPRAPHREQGRGGQQGAEDHGKGAERRRENRRPSRKCRARRIVAAASGIAPRPRPPLQQGQQERERQEPERELRRGGPIRQREPRGVDAGREGLHPEEGDRSVIRDHLHRHEQHAGQDRGPGHRQDDAAPGRPGSRAEAARDLERAASRQLKRGACQQVDVGIERQRKHEGRAAQRTDLGEPVVARAPAGDIAQHRLHRARKVEDVGVGIRQDVGRKGQGQHQRRLEPASAGEVVGDNEPGGPRSDQRRAETYQDDQGRGGGGVARQNRRGELGDRVEIAEHRRDDDRHHGQQAGERHQDSWDEQSTRRSLAQGLRRGIIGQRASPKHTGDATRKRSAAVIRVFNSTLRRRHPPPHRQAQVQARRPGWRRLRRPRDDEGAEGGREQRREGGPDRRRSLRRVRGGAAGADGPLRSRRAPGRSAVLRTRAGTLDRPARRLTFSGGGSGGFRRTCRGCAHVRLQGPRYGSRHASSPSRRHRRASRRSSPAPPRGGGTSPCWSRPRRPSRPRNASVARRACPRRSRRWRGCALPGHPDR